MPTIEATRLNTQRPMQGSPAQRAISYTNRPRSDDSWVEIGSQRSSSSLSSLADEIVTTGLRVQDGPVRRRHRLRPGAPTHLNVTTAQSSAGETSSQEEYEESESESDRVMTSSNEGLIIPVGQVQPSVALDDSDSEEEDENRTAVNDPVHNCFTPQPNAFSHPPASCNTRSIGDPTPGSYFPSMTARPHRASARHSYPAHEGRVQHSPYNAIAPRHNAAVDHEAALRASLSTLLSCAAAARALPKSQQQQAAEPSPRPTNRVEPNTLRLVPESRLPGSSPTTGITEPTFQPTIRRRSTSTSASADDAPKDLAKRKASTGRSSSKDRRAVKKRRASSAAAYNADEVFVSPTLLTWVVSAGVVVVLSAISFSAGYSVGKEAGRLEAVSAGSEAGSCAREAGRTGLGLRRLRFATSA